MQAFVTELNAKHADLDAALTCGRHILDLAHVEAVPIVQAKVHELDKKWSKLKTAAGERSEELATALLEMKGLQDVLDKLLVWVDEAETWMDTKDLEPVEEELEAIEMQLAEHEVWVGGWVCAWVCACARVLRMCDQGNPNFCFSKDVNKWQVFVYFLLNTCFFTH